MVVDEHREAWRERCVSREVGEEGSESMVEDVVVGLW